MSKKQRDTNRTARAAAVRREQATRERRRRLLVTGGILVVLALVVGIGVLLGGRGEDPAPSGELDARADGPALVLGSSTDAPKVVVYEDFLCPYCREFEAASRTTLRDAAARDDAVVEYRPFHLLPDAYSSEALTAWAAVLQKGTPQQALRFHDLLFENQPYEAAADKPGIDDLVDLAKKAGVRNASVLDAMRQPDEAFVRAAGEAARSAGVQGTPTVFVDGTMLQGTPSELVDQLKQRLGKG